MASIIREDPANEVAWVWLATCVDEPEKKGSADITQTTSSVDIPMSNVDTTRIAPQTTKSDSLSNGSTSPDLVVFKWDNGILTLVIALALVVLAWILLR